MLEINYPSMLNAVTVRMDSATASSTAGTIADQRIH